MRYIDFDRSIWAREAAKQCLSKIISLNRHSYISVGLTGGRTAKHLYLELCTHKNFLSLKNINFYLTDERFVPFYSKESNYGMIKSTLFSGGIPNNCRFHHFAEIDLNEDFPHKKYNLLFPRVFDLLILTAGDDGHIASIFEMDLCSESRFETFFLTSPPLGGLKRISITPTVIRSAKDILVLAPGEVKKILFTKLMSGDENDKIPSSLVKRGFWMLSHGSKVGGWEIE